MYVSTRANYQKVTAAQAIAMGMVPEGGLFVPETIPALSLAELKPQMGKSYKEWACWILEKYLDDYTAEEIQNCIAQAYSPDNFDHPDIAPLVELDDHMFIMELWHGPTAAFKDMALQLTPYLLTTAIKKLAIEKKVVILVATSGDTGKAALEGFKDVPGTEIIVFYPAHGVSEVQKLQMVTTTGRNTHVVAVEGNFDDCQSALKEIFVDKELIAKLEAKGYQFSSANSINWGRLLPQIIYYFASYSNLVRDQRIAFGDVVNFVVPTGNFGNILAGWYAKEMGLPIGKLVCASNENKVLTDFFQTGRYDRKREFKQTNSPSMDILISSNLERFLYAMTGNDGAKVAKWMQELQTVGEFQVDAQTKTAIDACVCGGFANEDQTLETIHTCYEQHHYLLDTHTAVALKVYQDYQQSTHDDRVVIIDSTANPYKFVSSVYQAVNPLSEEEKTDDLQLLEQLQALSKMLVHRGLLDLDKKEVRHEACCARADIKNQITTILNL